MTTASIQLDQPQQMPVHHGRPTSAVDALRGRKVLIVLGSLEMGGAQRQAILLARLLKEAGAVVKVWGFWKTTGGAADLCDSLGIPWRIVSFRMDPWAGRPLRQRVRSIGMLRQLPRVIRAMREERPDAVVPFYTAANLVCGLSWRWAGVRTCIWNQRDSGMPIYPRLEAWTARRAPACISNSLGGREFMQTVYGVAQERVTMIYNAVELQPPQLSRGAWRSRLGAGEHTLVVCMLGNLVSRKDHLTLVEAWRGVVDAMQHRGRRVLLVLAGYGGDTATAVARRIAELNLEPHIETIGETSDVSGLLGASDMGVLSSHVEGTPNGVLECMAAGLAVVATDLPGVREALGPGAAGFVAAPRDASGLVDRLITLLSDADLRRTAGAANRARIESLFTPQRMLGHTAELLSRLLASSADVPRT